VRAFVFCLFCCAVFFFVVLLNKQEASFLIFVRGAFFNKNDGGPNPNQKEI